MYFCIKVILTIQNVKEIFLLALFLGIYVIWRTIILPQDAVVNCWKRIIFFVENWLWWLISFHCRETEFGPILDVHLLEGLQGLLQRTLNEKRNPLWMRVVSVHGLENQERQTEHQHSCFCFLAAGMLVLSSLSCPYR